MNSIVETISAFIQRVVHYFKELFLFLHYGVIEWWRVEGPELWAKAQTWLTEPGFPVRILVVTILLLIVFGLLIRLFRRRPKPVAPPREANKPPKVTARTPTQDLPRSTTIPLAATAPAPWDALEVPETTPPAPDPVPEKPVAATLPPATPPEPLVTTPLVPEPTATPPPAEKFSFFDRLKKGLHKTRQWLTDDLNAIFQSGKLDDETLEDLEEMLITADVGVQTSMEIVEKVGRQKGRIKNATDLKTVLQEIVLGILTQADGASEAETPFEAHLSKPHVMMVVGVNGVGKTTTIGKLAARYVAKGKKVLLGAADTFRAAAVEQLDVWADRADTDIVKHNEGSDPAAVAFDSVDAAIARDTDIVLVDTAGRLHTKVNLMEEIKKVQRSINKRLPEAPHEVLLVLDATTGQNGLAQAKKFNDALGLTGLILTKLDGTAKGGVVIGICDTLNIPLCYLGVGEQIDDLQPFESDQFVQALFE